MSHHAVKAAEQSYPTPAGVARSMIDQMRVVALREAIKDEQLQRAFDAHGSAVCEALFALTPGDSIDFELFLGQPSKRELFSAPAIRTEVMLVAHHVATASRIFECEYRHPLCGALAPEIVEAMWLMRNHPTWVTFKGTSVKHEHLAWRDLHARYRRLEKGSERRPE